MNRYLLSWRTQSSLLQVAPHHYPLDIRRTGVTQHVTQVTLANQTGLPVTQCFSSLTLRCKQLSDIEAVPSYGALSSYLYIKHAADWPM